MLYALYGADRLAVRACRDALLLTHAPDGAADMALARLDGSRCTPDELQMACGAISFFGGGRVIVVDDLMTRFESARRGKPAAPDEAEAEGDTDEGEPTEAADSPAPAPDPPPTGKRGKAGPEGLVGKFVAVLNNIDAETTVILWERGDIRATNPLLALVKKRGTVEEFKPPRGLAVEQWISNRAREQDIRLAPGVPALLATYAGDDPEVLASELDKLGNYAGVGAPVTEAMVRLLTPQLGQAAAFDLITAMGQRDAARALGLLRGLLTNGEKGYAIVGLLGWQVRSLLGVQALSQQRLSVAAIAERLGMKEFPVRKTQESLRYYTPDSLRTLHTRLLQVDQAIKTGGGDGTAALELLVLEMSRGRA